MVLGRRLSQDDGPVFLERTLDLKLRMVRTYCMRGRGHTESKRGENKMKPVMVDEEVHTRDSDGRSYSGSWKNEGNIFRSCQ